MAKNKQVYYVWDRNQMQTMMDAEIVVYSETSREAGYQKYEVQNSRQKGCQSKTLSEPRIRISAKGKDWQNQNW